MQTSPATFASSITQSPHTVDELYAACFHNDPEAVEVLLKSGVSGHQINACGNSLLHEVCIRGYSKIAHLLIQHRAVIEYAHSEKRPLHVACENGQYEIVELLVAQNANVNAPDKQGLTPLHHAAKNSDPRFVTHLLEHGANPLILTKSDESALYIACEHNNLEIVKILSSPTCDTLGNLPLGIACAKGYSSIVEFLLEKQDSSESPYVSQMFAKPFKNNLLHLSCRRTGIQNKERARIMEALFQRGAKVTPDELGETQVHIACSHGLHNAVDLLLNRDADLNALSRAGYTPLHHACTSRAYKAAKKLLQHKADPNIPTKDGYYPLHYTVLDSKLTQLLLKNGAELRSLTYFDQDKLLSNHEAIHTNNEEESHRDLALVRCIKKLETILLQEDEKTYSEIVQVIKAEGQQSLNFALSIASLKNYPRACKKLIEAGADANQVDPRDNTLLSIISSKGYFEIAKLLLEHGACVNLSSTRSGDHTALHYASANGHLAIVSLLLKFGAKVDAPNRCNSTPLHEAAESGHFDVVLVLSGHFAQIQTLNNKQESPLFLACKNGHLEIVKLLVSLSDVLQKDLEDNTPAHIACLNGHVSVVEFLTSQHNYNEEKNRYGYSLLHSACDNEDIPSDQRDAIVLHLLQSGFDINMQAKLSKMSPLHLTCLNGMESTSKILIENNAILDSQTAHEQETPLHLASSNNSLNTVQLLLSRGASPNVYNSFHSLPLNHAKIEVARILLKHGSKVDGRALNGTALHDACRTKNIEMIELLLSYGADPLLKDRNKKTVFRIVQELGFREIEAMLQERRSNAS